MAHHAVFGNSDDFRPCENALVSSVDERFGLHRRQEFVSAGEVMLLAAREQKPTGLPATGAWIFADKAYDANGRVLEPMAAAGKAIVIPPKANRKPPRKFDRHFFKARHLIENVFARLKLYRAIAMRYDETKRNFVAVIRWVAAVIWLN